MIKSIIYILFTAMLLSACKQEIWIDNPTSNSLKVVVAGKEHKIKAHSVKIVKVSKGINSVLCIENGDTLVNENVAFIKNGILNVTKEQYAIWRDLFCEENDYENLKTHLNLKDTVLVDGLVFLAIDLALVDDLFIPNNWDLDLQTSRPDSINIGKDQDFKIITKIYRKKALKEAFNYYGDYDFKNLSQEEIDKVLNNQMEK